MDNAEGLGAAMEASSQREKSKKLEARVAALEAVAALERMQWNPDMDAAPYEKNVLTLWEGNKKLNPVTLINIKCDGNSLGSRDSWWKSKPTQWPTHWMHLPEADTT